MADKDIIQNMIEELGQSQAERAAKELGVHYADLDERTSADLLLFATHLSPLIRFYPADGGGPTTWAPFFTLPGSADAIVEQTDGQMTPHLALYLAFLKLYQQPQELLNGITGRHLDFYYRDVLRLSEKAAVPDRAHVVLELKKGAQPVQVGPDNLLTAGKDATGVELTYAPVRETIANTASVSALRSTYLDRTGRGTIRHAPIANSADGLGGTFASGDVKWPGFGGPELPAAEVGFALASPVLRMQEGTRTVTMQLALGNLDAQHMNAASLQHAFDVYITGPKKWMGPLPVSVALRSGGILEFRFTVGETDPAVVDYSSAVHGYAYAAQAPVVQAMLRTDNAAIGYLDFQNVRVLSAQISVDVANVKSLALESDAGSLDPKKAFLPFGPQPTAGSRFMVGYSEALTKKLSSVSISIDWKDIPTSGNFASYYSGYNLRQVNNAYFTAGVKFRDGGGHEFAASQGLFDSSNALRTRVFSFSPSVPRTATPVTFDQRIYALAVAGSSVALREAESLVRRMPVMAPAKTNPTPLREGYITFALDRDFLHSTYRQVFLSNVLKVAKDGGTLPALNEPYTPAVQGISLSYSAHADRVNIASTALDDFAGGEIQFYHITPSGPRREHGYLRRQLEVVADRIVTMLPDYHYEGELLIGLAGLHAGDSVSLLFQLAEGSADPDLLAQSAEWSVLCDNHWQPVSSGGLALDTTNRLRASGIVTLVVPTDATADNTVLPAGLIWIRAGLRTTVTAACRMIDVLANAIEVRFVESGNDTLHLASALPAGSIKALKKGLTAVKSVSQPYASFGGSMKEAGSVFSTRVSERLRHKNRCITPWDYERVILEAFPNIHRVKCIPHAKEGSWRAPGHVLIVLVPDLRNRNAIDPLEPRVDAGTIDVITQHASAHAGMGVNVKVTNPRYQKIRLDFKVRFHAGHEFNYYRNALEGELIRALSPWAFDAAREIAFGGTIYKSVLLDIVEDLPYVDYVTDFRMYSYRGDRRNLVDRAEVHADTPDMVLVSDSSHTIVEIPL
ncbi:MAG TPA: hypothetical protein VHI13_22565 [Candidatus Kapabacteria bacterium]|nr:hypothetical protein [Candidatus Kapabacteria bacterium]